MKYIFRLAILVLALFYINKVMSLDTITFTKDNVVSLTGEVTPSSVDKLIIDIETLQVQGHLSLS